MRRPAAKRLVSVVFLASLAAGCLAATPDGPAAGEEGSAPPALDLQVSGCREGGSYVTWNAYAGDRNFPFGLVPTDVTDDVGRPPTTSAGHPQEGSLVPNGNVTGAYHPLVHCESWTAGGEAGSDLLLAFVGGRIVPPGFDLEPVARQYLAGFLAVDQPAVAAVLESAGYSVETLTDTTFSLDGQVLRTVIHFSHHGDIYASIPFKQAEPKPDETIRLWLLDLEDRTALRALDLVDKGGTRLVASGPGAFEHLAGSAQPPLPGAPLHTYTSWMMGYTGMDRSFRAGPLVVVGAAGDHGHLGASPAG